MHTLYTYIYSIYVQIHYAYICIFSTSCLVFNDIDNELSMIFTGLDGPNSLIDLWHIEEKKKIEL